MKKVSDLLSKCISLMYAICFPLSFCLFLYLSVAYKGNMLFGYVIDIVKIIVILLFANNVLFMYEADEDAKKSSKYFVILAGIILLEFVYTVCMHGKYNYGGKNIIVIYMFFFAAEFIVETIAFVKLIGEAYGGFMIRFGIITFLVITFGLSLCISYTGCRSGLPLVVIVLLILLRDIIKGHFLIKSVIMRKHEVSHDKN
ncbi:hypothetical protein [Butyrivibrio proteoclasticus]|uniref:hypothetical protein n=1 Tax=Butyrivibrio proteoclasticus TaxID=43305 RepID=UPI00047B9398|nr:hypothetical protein [Butyrivibrio proteoclasticus]